MNVGAHIGKSNASRVVSTLLENETLSPKPAAQCAWCRKWLDTSGNYIPEPPHDPKGISHGICQSCLDKMSVDSPKPISAA